MSDSVSPVGRISPAVVGPSLMTGVISDPPRNLAAMMPGTILKGTVLGRGADGLVVVATDKGTVSVATQAQIPTGTPVTLEIRNVGDRLQVLILATGAGPSAGSTAGSTPSGTIAGGATASGTIIAGGNPESGVATSGTAGGATVTGGAASGPVRVVDPPAIEITGSSLKAIIVQMPPAGLLLVTPDPGSEISMVPQGLGMTPVGAEPAAQSAMQTQQAANPAAILPTSSEFPFLPPAGAAPTAAVPSPPEPPLGLPGISLPATGITLQPEIANKIAALFAAEIPGAGLPVGGGVVVAGAAPSAATAPFGNNPTVAFPPGTELALHVLAVLPAPGQSIEIAPEAGRLASVAAPLVGQVLGYTRAGYPVIGTPAGTLVVQQKTQLPVGARVALAFELVKSVQAAEIPVPSTPQQALLYFSRGWPTLADLFALLSANGAPNAPDGTPAHILLPQTGPKLAAGLANAAAAVRSGNIEALLGSLLMSGRSPADKEDAVKRLRLEFSQLSDLAKDRSDVDWRALFLPLYDVRAGLSQINLYYRQSYADANDDPEKKKGTGTRFIVEVNFALLGAFQLDGLIRRKRFDLMIRSRKRLTQSQRRDIHGIFEEALGLGGYAGALEFRTVETFPVAPLDEMQHSHGRLTA